MRTVCNLGPLAGTALLSVAVCAAVACGSLDRSVLRNQCVASSDCNPGRVCLAGICQVPTDGSADAPIDAPLPDAGPTVAVEVDAADAPAAMDARVDAPDAPTAAGIDAPDDVPESVDVADGPASGFPSVDATLDGRISPPPPDPCVTGPGQESPAAMPGLLLALPGQWRLCPASDPIDPDVSWLVGSTHLVQLDARRWWRCTDGAPPSCNATAEGLYFRVLEGANSVFHFADQIDPVNGGGADISIHYFAGSRLLQLVSCDGASRCEGGASYLAFVGPVPGS